MLLVLVAYGVYSYASVWTSLRTSCCLSSVSVSARATIQSIQEYQPCWFGEARMQRRSNSGGTRRRERRLYSSTVAFGGENKQRRGGEKNGCREIAGLAACCWRWVGQSDGREPEVCGREERTIPCHPHRPSRLISEVTHASLRCIRDNNKPFAFFTPAVLLPVLYRRIASPRVFLDLCLKRVQVVLALLARRLEGL